MAVTIKFTCAPCGDDFQLKPDAFTFVTFPAMKWPWMVWRCPGCDDSRGVSLEEYGPEVRGDLRKEVKRVLHLSAPQAVPGQLEVDDIIDVDVAWEAMSALYRSKLT